MPTDELPTAAMAVPAFTPSEREGFFASIERHRRAASRVSMVAAVCAAALAFVVAVLMSPLLYAIIGLALDVASHFVATPDLMRDVAESISSTTDQLESVPAARWIRIACIASIPGLVVMALAWHTLGRITREAMGSDAVHLSARPIDATSLAEQRFANVVAEMAVAAGLETPRVLVADNAAVNAAAFGADRTRASIVITTGLLAELDRAQLQGIAAHLVGSIANGDMKVGARFATALAMFGLIAKLGTSFADRDGARRFMTLLFASLKPGGSASGGQLVMELTNPFEPEKPVSASADSTDAVPWRSLLWMPLAGPLAISGFFGGLLCTLVLGPLLSLTWRRRKYMADATAVQLTRDPDTLGQALEKLRGSPVEGAFGAWIAHLCVMPGGLIGAKSILGGSSVPMSPSLDKRLRALGVMGAHVSPRAERVVPAWAWAILGPVCALVAGLMGVVVFGLLFVSIALSGLFTWLPALLIHAIIR
jgi:Zn-dependent protease with chaperone function